MCLKLMALRNHLLPKFDMWCLNHIMHITESTMKKRKHCLAKERVTLFEDPIKRQYSPGPHQGGSRINQGEGGG